ncbi:Hypothetical protein CINCED_3A021287 [Cinara cedri]|uniref:Uncharacterized protein n=1 Tax=Cinara cedri TaxID=506608 RepID=A0A5E4M3S0_9HEMI|nr:Hypothetical protein CINCED_3A021287 [Cinara cedri]
MSRTDKAVVPMAAGHPLPLPPLSSRLAPCGSVCPLPWGRRTVSHERRLPRSNRVKSDQNPGWDAFRA